jgi:uncharacterized protein YpiB (UPF0302 family)
MNHTITTTLSEPWYNFLISETKEAKLNKKGVIESALGEYKKQKLLKAIEEGLKDKNRQQEYRQICADFAKMRPRIP